jgi:choline dehydrogenase-like flavoprotein
LGDHELAPHFAAVEAALSIGFHPTGGGPASRKLRDGAAALGWDVLEVPRWVDVDVTEGGRRTETRRSMRRSYLANAVEAGARILTGCRVRRLRRRSESWEVEARWTPAGGVPRPLHLQADTVVLSAGAIQTPALLRRSGIRSHVGDTLALHPTAKMAARFPDGVHGEGEAVGVHQVPHFKPDFSLGCSVSSAPYQALALLEHREALGHVAEHAHRTAVYYAMTSGGEGTVRTVPGFADPLVRYDVGTDVLERLSRGLLALGRALQAAGAEELYPVVAGVGAVRTREGLAAIPSVLPGAGANLMTVHLMGTCPMGERRDRCAVDSFGHVHGQRGLLVADASLFCGAVGVNPQGTLMALVRRNALRFLGQA